MLWQSASVDECNIDLHCAQKEQDLLKSALDVLSHVPSKHFFQLYNQILANATKHYKAMKLLWSFRKPFYSIEPVASEYVQLPLSRSAPALLGKWPDRSSYPRLGLDIGHGLWSKESTRGCKEASAPSQPLPQSLLCWLMIRWRSQSPSHPKMNMKGKKMVSRSIVLTIQRTLKKDYAKVLAHVIHQCVWLK